MQLQGKGNGAGGQCGRFIHEQSTINQRDKRDEAHRPYSYQLFDRCDRRLRVTNSNLEPQSNLTLKAVLESLKSVERSVKGS